MRKYILYLFLSFVFTGLQAQKLTLTGYIKDMQGFYYLETPFALSTGASFQWTTYNQIHNRLNIEYQPVENLRFELGVRNRLLAGKLIGDIPGYASLFETDNGLADLSWNLAENKNGFMNTSIDRLYVDYTWRNLQLKAGRQRINWGINLVWNPKRSF